jgi:hypothetical protein
MSFRLTESPWWVRCVVAAVVVALLVGPLWWATLSFQGVGALGWALTLGLMSGCCLLIGAAVVTRQQPSRGAYFEALRGLNKSQRAQALEALRVGGVPDDAAVVAGAIRLGDLWMVYRGRRSRWARAYLSWLPAGLVVLACVDFFTNNVRQGLVWIWIAALVTVYTMWLKRRWGQWPRHLEQLRAAAPDLGQQGEPTVASTRRVLVLSVLTAILAGGIVAVPLVFFSSHKPGSQCRTADAAIGYVHDKADVTDPHFIGSGDPPLASLQQWSDQLHTYASQVSAPDIAPHMRRIADLSARVVSQVRDARQNPGHTPSYEEQMARQNTYQGTIEQLYAEEREILAVCDRS